MYPGNKRGVRRASPARRELDPFVPGRYSTAVQRSGRHALPHIAKYQPSILIHAPVMHLPLRPLATIERFIASLYLLLYGRVHDRRIKHFLNRIDRAWLITLILQASALCNLDRGGRVNFWQPPLFDHNFIAPPPILAPHQSYVRPNCCRYEDKIND